MNEVSEMTASQLLREYKEVANADLNDHVDCSLSTIAFRKHRLEALEQEIERRGLKLPTVEEINFEKQCEGLREDLASFRKSLRGEE